MHDTLRFLRDHDQIYITNERGHSFGIRGTELFQIKKIVVFRGGRALPEDCQQTRYHLSTSEGFVHIIELHRYLGILRTLRLPRDIMSYLDYRERVCPTITESGIIVDESDIMGAFISDESMPSTYSRNNLKTFIQDTEDFDLSRHIGDLHAHIEKSTDPYDYYQRGWHR